MVTCTRLCLYIFSLLGCSEYCQSLIVLKPHDLTYSGNVVSAHVFPAAKLLIKILLLDVWHTATKIHWFSALWEGEVLSLLVLWVFYCNFI